MAKIEIKIVKSTIGRIKKNRKTVQALGLKKIGQTVVREATPSTLGMVKAVDFMLEVKEVE